MTPRTISRILTIISTISMLLFGICVFYAYNLQNFRQMQLGDIIMFQVTAFIQAAVMAGMFILSRVQRQSRFNIKMHWRAYFDSQGKHINVADRYLLTPTGTAKWYDNATLDLTEMGSGIICNCTTIDAANNRVVQTLLEQHSVLTDYLGFNANRG